MLWHGSRNSGGFMAAERQKKTNYMWHGRGISGGLWSPDFPRSVDGPLKEYFVLYLYTLRQKSVISIFLKY